MQDVRTVTQIGLDSHRRFSRVSARDSSGRVVWRQRLEHADRSALREALSAWPQGVPVVLEATFGWGWLSDELSAAGLSPHLSSGTKVAAWRKARGVAKTDRTDADLLSELPMGPVHRWWEVWLAPPVVREQREWMRYRMTLVRLQTGLKNRVHAVLHRHGIAHEHADLFGTAGRRMLSLLVASAAGPLPSSGRVSLKGYLQLLDQLRRQIAGYAGVASPSPALGGGRAAADASGDQLGSGVHDPGGGGRDQAISELSPTGCIQLGGSAEPRERPGRRRGGAAGPARRPRRSSHAEVGLGRGSARRGAVRGAVSRDLRSADEQWTSGPQSRVPGRGARAVQIGLRVVESRRELSRHTAAASRHADRIVDVSSGGEPARTFYGRCRVIGFGPQK